MVDVLSNVRWANLIKLAKLSIEAIASLQKGGNATEDTNDALSHASTHQSHWGNDR